MPKFVRVRDKKTGHEFSVLERQVDASGHQVLNKSAYSVSGDVAPPKFKTTVKKAAEKKAPTARRATVQKRPDGPADSTPSPRG